MKRAIRWTWLVFVVAILMPAGIPAAWGAPPAAQETSAPMAGYLENVTFEKLPGKERVTLAVSKQSGVTIEHQPGDAVVVRLENLFVPEGLRRPLGDGALANVVRVTPTQKLVDGRSWVLATIELKRKVPYSIRQEGMNVLIDFNVTSLASAAEPVAEKASVSGGGAAPPHLNVSRKLTCRLAGKPIPLTVSLGSSLARAKYSPSCNSGCRIAHSAQFASPFASVVTTAG